jgi:ACS family tartrate transporter-like MFS transporter
MTMLSGLVHTAGQFYMVRFFLGLAEASFFPGMIVYLTHWFRQSDRGRAIAILYAALSVSSIFGTANRSTMPLDPRQTPSMPS